MAWAEEQLHAQYIRGLLLRTRRPTPAAVILGRQAVGAISGWVTATRHHDQPADSPIRRAAAGALVMTARLTGRIDPHLAAELRPTTFRRYCQLNVALERTAERSYRRVLAVAADAEEADAFRRIGDEEARHARLFAAFARALTADDRLATGVDELREEVTDIGEVFLPGRYRTAGQRRGHAGGVGSGAPVVVRGRGGGAAGRPTGSDRRGREEVLVDALDAAGIGDLPGLRGGVVAIRTSFMLGYDRADPSVVVHPATVRALAAYCRSHGAARVRVLDAPTVYDRYFANRSVAEVARYLGYSGEREYEIVDIGADQRRAAFHRGMVSWTISAAWQDADVRLVLAPFRTDPTEGAHLCLATLEGTAGRIDDTVHLDRVVDFRTTTMMAVDEAPADAGIVDAWGPVAVGTVGVMGCDRPAHPRRIYAGRDLLTVDRAVLADLGVPDDRGGPIVRHAHRWFGLPFDPVRRDGDLGPFGPEVRTPWRTRLAWTAAQLAHPVYATLSDRGRRFVPAMDTAAFPPSGPVDPVTRAVRWAAQTAFGLHAPRPEPAVRRLPRRLAHVAMSAATVRHRGARLAAIGDSRAMVRLGFLASAVRMDLFALLPATRAELVEALGAAREDRLKAWLAVGVALGELGRDGPRYTVRGRRSRALAAGDAMLQAHYRSVLEYQMPAFAGLADLLGGDTAGDGTPGDRRDVEEHGGTIAAVSLGAAPFLTPVIREAARHAGPGTILDAGCGSGHYLRVALDAAPHCRGLGVDRDEAAVAMARAALDHHGVSDRAEIRAADLTDALSDGPFTLVLLLNNLYYVPQAQRQAHIDALAAALDDGGELVVAGYTAPGSVGAVQLDWLLRIQHIPASLPPAGSMRRMVEAAGLTVTDDIRPVPGEPYQVLRARRTTTLPPPAD